MSTVAKQETAPSAAAPQRRLPSISSFIGHCLSSALRRSQPTAPSPLEPQGPLHDAEVSAGPQPIPSEHQQVAAARSGSTPAPPFFPRPSFNAVAPPGAVAAAPVDIQGHAASTAIGLLLFTTVVCTLILVWMMVAPYVHGIAAALALSLLFHRGVRENNSTTDRMVTSIRSRTDDWRQARPWLPQWLARQLASVAVFDYFAGDSAQFWGIAKMPVLGRWPVESAYLCGAVFLWAIGGFWMVGVAVFVGLCLFIAAPVMHASDFVRRSYRVLSIATVLLLVSGVGYNVVIEVLQMRGDVTTAIAFVQAKGFEVPSDLVEQGLDFVSSRLLPPNSSHVVRRLLPALWSNLTTTVARNCASAGDGDGARCEDADATPGASAASSLAAGGAGAFPPWSAFLDASILDAAVRFFHSVTADDKALLLAIAQTAVQGAVSVVNRTVAVVALVAAWGYEVLLCLLLFTHLMSRHHTIIYYVVEKIAFVIHHDATEAKEIAAHQETRLTGHFRHMFACFTHIVSFHFCLIFVLFRVVGVSYPAVSGTVASMVALVPIGFPKFITPAALAMGAAAWRGDYPRLIALGAVILPLYSLGDDFLLSHLQQQDGNAAHHQGGGASRRQKKATTKPPTKPPHQDAEQSGVAGVDAPSLPAETPAGADTPLLTPKKKLWESFEMGTAVILGFTVFGLKGVVIGPTLLLFVFAMWRDDEVSFAAGSAAAAKSSTNSARIDSRELGTAKSAPTSRRAVGEALSSAGVVWGAGLRQRRARIAPSSEAADGSLSRSTSAMF